MLVKKIYFFFHQDFFRYFVFLFKERDSPTNENATYHILLQHLERFGGFPPLYGQRWQPKLSVERLLATLHLEFNVEPLFELKVAADDMNNSQHIILVIIK